MKKAALCLVLALSPHMLPAATGYLVHNLVADDKATATADFYDSRLINPWGNVASAAGPFWVCDLGVSTIYTVSPTNATPMGTPNATTPPTFPVTAPGKAPVAASFIFVTEDGVLSAWANGADPTQALVQMDNSSSAAYKGLALVVTPAV